LNLQDVEAARAGRIYPRGVVRGGILVTVFAPDPLIASGGKRPAAIPGAGTVTGQDYGPHRGTQPCVVKGAIKLIYCAGSEGIANVGAVEGDTDKTFVGASVIGHISEILTPLDRAPVIGIEQR
jgi:hypothetical protein